MGPPVDDWILDMKADIARRLSRLLRRIIPR
jgi:hypothetical protein